MIERVYTLQDYIDTANNRVDLSPIKGRKIKVIDTSINDTSLLPDGTVYGNYSYTLPDKTKLIPYAFARHIGDFTETETGFTRLFMKTLPKRRYRKIQHEYMKVSRPPLYVRPSVLENAVYVDLVAAYPSVYKLIGWNVDYLRGQYLGIEDSLEYPYDPRWKVGRSYVVTGALPFQFSRFVKDGKIEMKRYYSQLANPSFVACVYDVLSMVGKFATYALDARYWNADGGIMRAEALDTFVSFVEVLGLKARVKYMGKAVILSSGYWRVGAHATKNMENKRATNIHGGDYNSMSVQDANWLFERMTKGKLW